MPLDPAKKEPVAEDKKQDEVTEGKDAKDPAAPASGPRVEEVKEEDKDDKTSEIGFGRPAV